MQVEEVVAVTCYLCKLKRLRQRTAMITCCDLRYFVIFFGELIAQFWQYAIFVNNINVYKQSAVNFETLTHEQQVLSTRRSQHHTTVLVNHSRTTQHTIHTAEINIRCFPDIVTESNSYIIACAEAAARAVKPATVAIPAAPTS